jgi:activating signal cointegrator complex subunit 3
VESSLLEVLPDHLNAEIVAGTVRTKQEALDYLTWTYFLRRLLQNPTYYNLESLEPEDVNSFLSNLVQHALNVLGEAYCISMDEVCDNNNRCWVFVMAHALPSWPCVAVAYC